MKIVLKKRPHLLLASLGDQRKTNLKFLALKFYLFLLNKLFQTKFHTAIQRDICSNCQVFLIYITRLERSKSAPSKLKILNVLKMQSDTTFKVFMKFTVPEIHKGIPMKLENSIFFSTWNIEKSFFQESNWKLFPFVKSLIVPIKLERTLQVCKTHFPSRNFFNKRKLP